MATHRETTWHDLFLRETLITIPARRGARRHVAKSGRRAAIPRAAPAALVALVARYPGARAALPALAAQTMPVLANVLLGVRGGATLHRGHGRRTARRVLAITARVARVP